MALELIETGTPSLTKQEEGENPESDVHLSAPAGFQIITAKEASRLREPKKQKRVASKSF